MAKELTQNDIDKLRMLNSPEELARLCIHCYDLGFKRGRDATHKKSEQEKKE